LWRYSKPLEREDKVKRLVGGWRVGNVLDYFLAWRELAVSLRVGLDGTFHFTLFCSHKNTVQFMTASMLRSM
jgi:hypothetical protein